MNILLIQMVGHKRIRLVPSTDVANVYNDNGVFSMADVDRVDLDRFPLFAAVCVGDVTIGPGDALFVPVGWWHQVVSLDPSVSVSATNFTRSNQYTWD